MSLKRYYALTTAARLFWLDLFFVSLGLGLFFLVQLGGVAFSGSERTIFFLYLLFLVLLLDFIYLLGQLTTVLVRFRKIFFLWFFIVWFLCIFLLPEINRISVFNQSQALESAEKVNLEKFRTLMALEKKFRDYLKVNPGRAPGPDPPDAEKIRRPIHQQQLSGEYRPGDQIPARRGKSDRRS